MLEGLCRQIGRLKETGISILLVEQKLDFVLSFADRCHLVEKGRICHCCLTQELIKDDEVKKHYLGVFDLSVAWSCPDRWHII